MKVLAICCLLLCYSVKGQVNPPGYNDSLAKALGADDYGMKNYILVILKTGPNKTENKSFIDSCFVGHMSNMGKMEKAGQLIVAGPIGKNERNYRGIFILNTTEVDSAAEVLQSDPAIKAGLLEPELFKWYGSAALPLYLPYSHHISKKSY